MRKFLILSLSLFLLFVIFATAQAKPNSGGNSVNPPSSLMISAVSNSELNLSWIDNSYDEHGFIIEHSIDGIDFVEIAGVDTNVISYLDQGLTPASTHYYRVRAFKVQGNNTKYSAYSNISYGTTLYTAPAQPTLLSAIPKIEINATTTISSIDLSWQDNANNEAGFVVERSINGIDFTIYNVLSVNSESFTDMFITSGVVYYYRVYSYNNGGNSDSTNIASATAL